ncbi:signal recognition particle receptor subunit beta [Blastocystis sp. ATCC 50177/Nand II]|uniref:Signal recognition particle receptor subunit beta n=1 Tax=Blastocystis sp. subtype 1 (strain ATCC 50177 / NandII) TaxID=478820 RepID=A0A196SKP3_BLAHN|nr:signal recognition particle receptor subunit beta [Blastocystis sp. ATCC 50177/Nand II]
MSDIELQNQGLTSWAATWFYYLVFKFASWFHISDRKAFGIVLMLVLSLSYLIVVGLIAWRVFYKTKSRRALTIHGDSILLLGPSGSGKTVMFYAATGQGNAETVSSTKVNAASFVCEAYTKKEQEKKARKVRGKLIDFPGKADMRPELDQYFSSAEGIVFMVDGTHYDAKECGEYLYYILTNELYVDNPCPIMIAVNKSDLPECADHKKVLQDIENAVSDVVNNHRNTDGEKASALLAGNETFTFSDSAPCKVYSCKCSAKNQNLKKVMGFMTAAMHNVEDMD